MQSLILILSHSYSNVTKHFSTCRERVQLNKNKGFELLGALEALGYMETEKRER